MTITISGLPPAGRGHFYEAWLLQPASGKMLPVGVLLTPGSPVSYRLPATLTLGYSDVDISRQADDGEAKVQAAAPFDLYVATRLYAKRQTYDDVLRSGLSLIGGVHTVTRKLKQLAEMDVHHVLAIHNFGMMPQYQVMSSMDRFAAIAHAMNGSSAATDDKKSLVA
jgi:hypothetical protein